MMRSTVHRLLLATSLTFAAACSAGESAEAPDGTASGDAVRRPAVAALATGTMVDVALGAAISSRTPLVGDPFVGRGVGDVTTRDGTVVIPAGAAVHGTITDVSPASNTRSEGTLTLAVSSVMLSGRAYDLDASIAGLETVHEERGIEKADVARVVGGTAAGAVLGRVIGGDTKGTIIGGAAGAVAGTAVSVAVRDMDIVLPAGAHLLLSLTSPFTATR
jgi:hypothetical protein